MEWLEFNSSVNNSIQYVSCVKINVWVLCSSKCVWVRGRQTGVLRMPRKFAGVKTALFELFTLNYLLVENQVPSNSTNV